MSNQPLRIGILGAAKIGPMGLIGPARSVPDVQIVGVAARDPQRAQAYAQKHGLSRAYANYDDLLADPNIDAVYNPLPNNLHCEWTIKALRAGKHVLCEKPFASNAAEAEQMAQAASETGRILFEAFHYRYHPLVTRVREIIDSGELGTIQHIDTKFCFPLFNFSDIRWQYDLAGGSLMDAGSYAVSMLRFLAHAERGAEPEVVAAEAKLLKPNIDRKMTADFKFADGRTGRMTCAMLSNYFLEFSATVTGDAGKLRVLNPYHPQWFYWLSVNGKNGKHSERVKAESSYVHGLRAFAKAIRGEGELLTGPDESVATMRVIDAVYRKAGLQPRGT